MASLQDAYRLAVSHYNAGRIFDSEAVCQQIVKVAPTHADTFHLLSALAMQRKDHAQAQEFATLAIKHGGDQPNYLLSLARIYLAHGKLAEAEANFRKASSLQPQSAEIIADLGITLHQQNNHEEAIRTFRRAIRLRENFPEAFSIMGMAQYATGKIADALASCRKAIALKPDYVEGHINLGLLLLNNGELAEAEQRLRRATKLQPSAIDAYINLGILEYTRGEFEAALGYYRTALLHNPASAAAHINMGLAFRMIELYDDAEASFKCALSLAPSADAYNGLGIVANIRGGRREALDYFKRATEISPMHASAHWNQAALLFQQNDYVGGWEKHEWRWLTPGFRAKKRPFSQKKWQGQTNTDAPLLIWGEQGLGDEILHASVIQDLLAQQHNVLLECDKRLVTLFQRTWPALEIVARETPAAARTASAEYQLPAASLGQKFRTSKSAFPRHAGYLTVDAERKQNFSRALRTQDAALIVGISWISKNQDFENRKSLPLMQWGEVLQQPGVRFVDLQYGNTAEERATVTRELGVTIHHMDEIDSLNDIDGLAALTAACDLVITVSNTTAHISGAVGVSVWTIVPAGYDQLCYWFSNGSDTPWYPSAQLFRQSKPNEWKSTIAELAKELKKIQKPN